MLRVLILFTIIATAHTSMAEEEKLGLINQSELGYVVTGGNSQSETTSVKQVSEYKWQKASTTFTGHYIQSSGQVADNANPGAFETQTTAENWSAKLRYDRVIHAWFSGFVSHGWRGDKFQGVSVGHDTDLGAKYFTAKSKTYTHFFELGYRYTREFLVNNPCITPGLVRVGTGNCGYPEFHYARIFMQADYVYTKTFAVGLWVEYLPSIVNFSTDQRLNFSPYLTSVLTDMFSLKVSYESRYRFEKAPLARKYTDYTFTTALLAKF